jgi:ABC-type transport system involved in multi-copper enzyme maturation permease subunit
VVVVGASIAVEALVHYRWPTTALQKRASFDPVSSSLVGLLIGQFALGVLGVLVMSAEYRTGTIRASLTAAPRRLLVLLAKVLVFGVVALTVAEIVSFCAFFVGQALLGSVPHATLTTPGALRAVVGGGLFAGMLGVFALALAAVIRHTAGAISAFVGILLVLPIVVAALPSSVGNPIMRYLPAQMGGNMLRRTVEAGSFSPWVGFAIFCGYTVALFVVAGVLLLRRDAA